MKIADCFAYDRALIPVADAKTRLETHATAIKKAQMVPLGQARGRILANDIKAPRNSPAFDNAAVDGWACFLDQPIIQGSERFELIAGRAAAGHAYEGQIPKGSCIRILTGAPMPNGTNAVALQEEVRTEDQYAQLPIGLKPFSNMRPAGEDMAAGSVILTKGQQIRAVDIGALALMGFSKVEVYEPLKVAVFSTGDELLEVGQEFRPGAIFDANRHILMAVLDQLPVDVSDLGQLRDRREDVEAALGDAAQNFDMVVTSGGASQGDEDHVAAVLAQEGDVHFWRIALKPGRPLAFGQIGSALFVGLPGNPVAASVCFALFAKPLILKLGGALAQEAQIPLVDVGFSMKKQPGRLEMVRVRLEQVDGKPQAIKIPKQGSGVLTSLVEADGLLQLDPDVTTVEPGMRLPYLDFANLGLS